MHRVAALYLPMWPLDRLRRAERRAQPDPGPPASLEPLRDAAAAEQANACSVPRGGGWRPGARWAREERARLIEALPAHQRPPMRELGRRTEAAPHAFKKLLPETASAAGWPPSRSGLEENLPPLVTTLRTGNRVLIAAACPLAQALGIRSGMPLTQARAQVTGLDIRPAAPEADSAELNQLALALARRWAPNVAIEGEDTLLLDLSGVAHLYGGEARMARRLLHMLARRGTTARIAIADTPGAAWAMAHYRGTMICPPEGHAAAIADLPIEALRIGPETVELLHRLGIDRVGQLTSMPRAPLVRRFGTGLAARLEQALGRLPEPLHPVVPHAPIVVIERFAEPISTPEAIAHWLEALVERLAAALEARGLGARLVELVAERVDGVPQQIRVGLARPNRDAAHLLRLLNRRIEQVEPGYGIDSLALHLRRAGPLGAQPVTERLDEEAAPDLAPLVDTLATRIGSGSMWRSRPVESDVPERSVGRAEVLDGAVRTGPRIRIDDVGQLDRSPALEPWHPAWPKPARLLARPERLDHVMAEMPDHAPRRFTWRGRAHRVIRADGPERVQGEWWKRDAERASVRDYFRVEDEHGGRYWLFRRGDGERPQTGDLSWYLHGVFG